MAATTVFDPATLPSCVPTCGVLYDVNGACAAGSSPDLGACFCADPRLTAFSAGPMGVCDAACTNPNDLVSIRGWYTSFCAKQQQGGVSTSAPGTVKSGGGGGDTWLSNHYQWVIFLVIMVVAIVGIWVGACVWRKRYLRKRDRQYALATNLGHATESGRVVANDSTQGSIHVPGAGMFQPAPLESAAVYGEKTKGKKSWLGRDRS
ncbi:hypothetical protein QBC39DRAFT_39543 [Podospora conica]|nr:hypothetical protein QBC39DRAFT_39543 [Schizothecium conicum]